MSETKFNLIMMYGLRCMYCGEEVNVHKLQWHHIRPRYDFKRHNEVVDDSEKNGALLCVDCHRRIHQFDCEDLAYKYMTDVILCNKQIDENKRG